MREEREGKEDKLPFHYVARTPKEREGDHSTSERERERAAAV